MLVLELQAKLHVARRPASSIAKDSFRKWKCTVIRQAHKLVTRYGARVHLVMQVNSRYYVYDSGGAPTSSSWPPIPQDIVRFLVGDIELV